MPADYFSRHPAPIDNLTQHEREADMIDDGDDITVMRVLLDDTPPALTLQKLRKGAQNDQVYQRLKKAIQRGTPPTDEEPELQRYKAVWQELSIIEDLICRGERILIPNGQLPDTDCTLQEWVVDLGHSGHMGCSGM